MQWPGEVDVDIEVTAARRKQKHTDSLTAARDLAEAVADEEREFDLLIDVADPLDPSDSTAILDKAATMSCGRTEDDQSKWSVRALEITRAPHDLSTRGQDSRPPWWPDNKARCLVFQGALAGPGATRAPSQVRVWFGVPYESYVNSVMRKADSPQCAPGLPFLLAVDIGDLPDAFREMPRAVGGFMHMWRALSGLLLFQSMMGSDRTGWLWRLIPNPNAAITLPIELTAQNTHPSAAETYMRFRD
jgi:hypothetical protein